MSKKNDVDNTEKIKYDEVGKIGERHKNFILGKINTFLDNAIAKRRAQGQTDEQIAKELQLTSSDLMDEVIAPLARAYSNAVAKHASKADFVKEHTNGLNIDLKKGVDDAYDAILRNAERMIEYAKTVYRETAYANRDGSAGLRTRFTVWNELERAREQHKREIEAAAQETIKSKHSNNWGAFSVAPNEPAGSPNRIRTAIGKLLGLQEKLEANVKDMHTKRLNDRMKLSIIVDTFFTRN